MLLLDDTELLLIELLDDTLLLDTELLLEEELLELLLDELLLDSSSSWRAMTVSLNVTTAPLAVSLSR